MRMPPERMARPHQSSAAPGHHANSWAEMLRSNVTVASSGTMRSPPRGSSWEPCSCEDEAGTHLVRRRSNTPPPDEPLSRRIAA